MGARMDPHFMFGSVKAAQWALAQTLRLVK